MNLKTFGLAALVSGVLISEKADAQYPFHQPFFMPQVIQQTITIQPILVHPPIIQARQPLQYRTWLHLDELMQAQAEELPLSLKYLEPGFYQTIIEKRNFYYVVGGPQNVFMMEPATPGYIKPKNEQGICWNVFRSGIFELYAVGNDRPLSLGRVHLERGDKIRFHKIAEIDYAATIARPQQPTLAPQQPTLAPQQPTLAPPKPN